MKAYHWVNKTNKKDGVTEVCCHLGALSNCTGNNGGKCASKGKLEEPLMISGVVHQEEVGMAHESLLVYIAVITTVGELHTGNRQWSMKR